MTEITADDLAWLKSERMSDEDDGGGRRTGNLITFGAENEIFDDLSDVDRAAGDVSIRKVYPAVLSANAAKYLDAGAVVFRPPADPAVSVLLFSTEDYYDERADAQDLLQQGISRAAAYNAYLWGPHYAQQRSVLLWQFQSAEPPVQGDRLDLVALSARVETRHQVLWVTHVTEQDVEVYDGAGSFWVRSLTLEISDPLGAAYTGTDPTRSLPASSSLATRVFATRYVPDAVSLVGIRPLVTDA
jgi:hypothetical protein